MEISVHSIQSTLFDGKAEKLIARTTTGEITALDGHEPLLSALAGPDVRIVNSRGKEQRIKLPSGFLEVEPGSRVTVLINPA